MVNAVPPPTQVDPAPDFLHNTLELALSGLRAEGGEQGSTLPDLGSDLGIMMGLLGAGMSMEDVFSNGT